MKLPFRIKYRRQKIRFLKRILRRTRSVLRNAWRWFIKVRNTVLIIVIYPYLSPALFTIIGTRRLIGILARKNIWTRRNLQTLGGEPVMPDHMGYWLRIWVLLAPFILLGTLGSIMTLPIVLRLAVGVMPTQDMLVTPFSLFGDSLQNNIFIYGLRQNSPTEFLTNWFGLTFLYLSLPPHHQIHDARLSLHWLASHRVRTRQLAAVMHQMTAPIEFLSDKLGRFDSWMSWLGGNILLASGGIIVMGFFIITFKLAKLILGL